MTAKKPAKKPAAKRAKGPDNNKRLAELEAAEAERNAQAKPVTDYPFAYANGQAAARSGIPEDQAPVFFNNEERKAYMKGRKSVG